MAFMEKLGQVANKVGEVAGDAADLGKAKGKIALEKGKLADAYQAYGIYAYGVKMGNDVNEEEEAKLIEEIKLHITSMNALQAEAEAAKKEFKSDMNDSI